MTQYLGAHAARETWSHAEDDLRVRNGRVRHSCWLVGLVIWLIYGPREATDQSHALVSFPKKNVFHVQSVIVFTRPPPQSYEFPLLYTSVKSTTLVIDSRCILKCVHITSCIIKRNVCARPGPRSGGTVYSGKNRTQMHPHWLVLERKPASGVYSDHRKHNDRDEAAVSDPLANTSSSGARLGRAHQSSPVPTQAQPYPPRHGS